MTMFVFARIEFTILHLGTTIDDGGKSERSNGPLF